MVVAALWSMRGAWRPGRYLSAFDTYTYSGPNLAVTERAARSFNLALWNADIFGGTPHLGNPQAGTLYVPRLLTLVMDNNRALGLIVVAHVILLGLGLSALTRSLGAGWFSAGFVGVAAVLSGSVVTKAVQFEQGLVLAWAPWLILSVGVVLRGTRPWLACAGVAVSTGAALTAGHPQMVYEVVVVSAAVTAGLAVRRVARPRLVPLAAGVCLGVGMASTQLVAAFIATSESLISSGREQAALANPELVLRPTYAARAFLGAVGDRDPASTAGSFESIQFVGVTVAILAAVGLVSALSSSRDREWAIPLVIVSALAMIWSLGPRSMPFRWSAEFLPGFDLARGSVRWLLVVSLGALVLAGVGLESILRRDHPRRDIGVAVTSGTAGALLISAFGLGHERAIVVSWTLFALAVVTLVTVSLMPRRSSRSIGPLLLAGLAVVELGALSMHSIVNRVSAPTSYESVSSGSAAWLSERPGYTIAFTDDFGSVDDVVAGLRPNANVILDVRSIDGYDGGVQVTRRWAEALRRFSADPATDLPLRNTVTVPLDAAALARLGVRYVLVDNERSTGFVSGFDGPIRHDGDFTVWENPAWIGEAIAWAATAAVSESTAADHLRIEPQRYSTRAIVEGSGPALTCAEHCEPVGYTVERRRPEVVVVRTNDSSTRLLTIDQQVAPGWRVSIDGSAAELVEVDGLFMGVVVPAGPHEVTFEYRPWWLLPSLLFSAMAGVATAALAWWGHRRPRGSSSPLQSDPRSTPATSRSLTDRDLAKARHLQ